jgi:beta-phosphoglucomutase-like phosphatase (HAD superfamily)
MEYDIKPGIKGLIFDLDGTLADSMPYHFESWKKACGYFGASIDTSFLRNYTGCPGWLIAEAIIEENGLKGKVTADQILKIKFEEYFRRQHLVKPIESVTSIVRKYHGMLPMAVGSGGNKETVERTLDITGLQQYFDIVITSSDVRKHKPHPETFLRCAELMGIEPEYIEVFEDGDLGIEAAEKAGMKPTDVRGWYKSDW